MREENVMQPVHYEQLGKELGIKVNYYEDKEETGYLDQLPKKETAILRKELEKY
jgi:hypothetical protein